MALLILAQLFLDRCEQRVLDDRRHGNGDPLIRRRPTIADGPTGLLPAVTLGGRFRQPRTDRPFAVAGAPPVRGVPQDAPHRAAVPARTAAGRRDPLLPESSRHLADAQALTGHPAKDALHDLRLGQADVETGLATR